MSKPVTIELTTTVTTRTEITPLLVAQMFAELTDDDQAQVFIEVAKIAATWDRHSGMQWFAIGRHLRDCECSTYDARDLVRDIASGLDPDATHAA